LLAECWPLAFSIYENRRRPLKIGIHLDIAATLDGAVTPAELALALRCYCANKVYRSRLIAGAVRIGLDGAPAGIVTEKEATQTPTTPASKIPSKAPTIPAPKRLSLADLQAAARERKAAVS